MSDFHYHRMKRSMDKAQREYDNKMPPEDDPTRECDECQDEYEIEVDKEGDILHLICPKCRKQNEEGPQQ